MLRLRTVSVLGLLFASAALSNAQPAKPTPLPLVPVLLPYVGDEGVQKDLKLTADQSKKLLAYRQKLWDESYNTPPKDIDFAAQNKATEAEFKAVLSADQLKRANQLAAQFVWTNRVGGFGPGGPTTTLPPLDLRRITGWATLQYPAIEEALKPDDTQKKLAATLSPRGNPWGGGIGGRAFANIYLTPKQVEAAKELIGAEYKGTLLMQHDTRGVRNFPGGISGGFPGGGQFFGLPPAFRYASAKDVQKELKLTEDQIKSLTELHMKWNQPVGGEDYRATSPAARAKANDERLAEMNKALAKILTADQRKRLTQIERQQQQGPGSDSAFFPGSELAKELSVTEAQIKKYDETFTAHAERVEKAMLSGQPFEKVKAAVEASDKEREKAVAAILTPEQQAKQKEYLGEPFTGNAHSSGGPGPGGDGVVEDAALRKLTFGRYSNELTTLTRYKGVQDVLKLTEEQIKKVSGANTEFRTKFPPREFFEAKQDAEKSDKFYADRSAFVEKALTDILTKEQFARFRELMLQRLESLELGRNPSGNGVAGYPGVADAIKLTAEQKQKLLEGGNAADVLTDEQKKLIKGMQGEAVKVAEVFNQPRPGGGGRDPFPTLSAPYSLLLDTIVWDGLKLTPDQLTKFVPVANEYMLVAGSRRGGFGPGGFPGGGFPGGGPGSVPGGGGAQPPTAKEATAVIEKFTTAVDTMLTAEQKKRLAQLAVQQALTNGLDTALLTQGNKSEFIKAMALTDAQKTKVSAHAEEAANVANLLDETMIPWEKELAVREKLREQLDTRVMKELTPDQMAKLKELTGEPFSGFTRQPLYRGGSGGGFGGGFGGQFGP